MSEAHTFLGTGWSFPPTFDNTRAQVAMLSGEDDIDSSLRILLATALGERIMQPKFGCNLSDMVFENLDVTLQTEMKNRIEKAILFYEPRVDLEGIALTPDERGGLIIIDVRYIVRATNTRGNLVYPFYLTEV
jgi:phage baseplate assembly protein W